MTETVVALVGAPYDGAATLGWPGARYAPDEVRRHLAWMRMRVQDDRIYWVDEDRIVPWRSEQLVDAGDAAIVPHDLVATLAAVRAKTAASSGWEWRRRSRGGLPRIRGAARATRQRR